MQVTYIKNQIMKYLLFLKHPLTILFTCLLLIIIAIIVLNTKPVPNERVLEPTPAESNQAIPSSSLPESKQLLNTETLPTGNKIYTYKSPLTDRPNEIITASDGNQIIYQRIVVPQGQNIPTINSYIEDLGDYDEAIEGSKYYGSDVITLIFASKGVAIIGAGGDKVLEIQKFQPMALEDYKQTYGSDFIIDNSH